MAILLLFINLKSESSTNQTSIYIDKYNAIAVNLMKEYNVPASVILGISMLESANGTSKLSKNNNNYFGIRTVKGPYIKFENDEQSFLHFAKLISTSKIYSKHYNYLVDNNIYDYNIWLDRIKLSGYATDPNWSIKVKNIINRHELYRFDDEVISYLK